MGLDATHIFSLSPARIRRLKNGMYSITGESEEFGEVDVSLPSHWSFIFYFTRLNATIGPMSQAQALSSAQPQPGIYGRPNKPSLLAPPFPPPHSLSRT